MIVFCIHRQCCSNADKCCVNMLTFLITKWRKKEGKSNMLLLLFQIVILLDFDPLLNQCYVNANQCYNLDFFYSKIKQGNVLNCNFKQLKVWMEYVSLSYFTLYFESRRARVPSLPLSSFVLCTNGTLAKERVDGKTYRTRFLGLLAVQVVENWGEYRPNTGQYKEAKGLENCKKLSSFLWVNDPI